MGPEENCVIVTYFRVRCNLFTGFFCLTAPGPSITILHVVGVDKNDNDEEWEFGDAWRSGSPDDAPDDASIDYIEVLRGDTGMGLDDTVMMEFVLFLGEHGIRATFESYPLEQIKIYVLRAEAGRAEEAMRLLADRRRADG
jgi:hypothetical protein